MHWYRCEWCDDVIHHDDDMVVTEDKLTYHRECWIDQDYEYRHEQYIKHAPDNMG